MGEPSPEERVHIWTRDNWRCRWCDRPVILAQALKYLAEEISNEHGAQPLGYYMETGRERKLLCSTSWARLSTEETMQIPALHVGGAIPNAHQMSAHEWDQT